MDKLQQVKAKLEAMKAKYNQEHEEEEELDLDGIHRGILETALEKLKEGEDRDEIIEETINILELI